jgi:TP901 family phage tail tape measure protein
MRPLALTFSQASDLRWRVLPTHGRGQIGGRQRAEHAGRGLLLEVGVLLRRLRIDVTEQLADLGQRHLAVADAASLVSNTLNAFHLKAQKAGDVANYLANAANASSSDVADLGEALKYVGPVAAASRVSLKQTTAILAELSNSSIGSTNAGTGFRKFLLSLQAPAAAASKDLKHLGVDIFDASGKMKPLATVIDLLSTKLNGLSDEKRQKIMKDLFGLQGISAAQVILDGGVRGLDKYSKAVDKAGAAQKLAQAASKGLMGTVKMIKADFISLAQSAYRNLSPLADKALRPIAAGLGNLASAAGPAMARFTTTVSTALSKIDLSGFAATVKAGFDNLQLPDLASKLHDQAQAWAAPTIDGFKTGLDTGDWSGLGKAVGNGLVQAINGAGAVAGKVFDGLDKLFAKVDWVGLGISIGKQAPSLVLGLAAGILNFDFMGLLKGVMKHWSDILLAVLAIAFTPGKIVGKVGELLARIPIAGKFLEWALLGTKKLGDGLVSGIWKALKFLGDAFLQGFRKIFPGAGAKFAAELAIFPLRLQLWALKLEEKGLRALLGLGKGIAKGAAAVLGKLGELTGRMLRPFADAGGWLIGQGVALMRGLQRGITRMLHPLLAWYRSLPMRILIALGDLSSLLIDAGKAVIHGLIKGITAGLKPLKNALGGVTSFIKDHKGPIEKDRLLLTPAGMAIMDGLIHGLKQRQPKLATVLDKLTAYIGKQADKITELMSKKQDVISSFQGLSASVFGATFTDAQGNDRAGSVTDLLNYQKGQLAKARQLQADVKALVGKGLSKALIQQMIDAGDSGVANLHTLAGGSSADISALNALDKATSAALGSAGNLAGNALYGKDIRTAQQNENLAKAIARELRAVLKEQGKDEYVVQLGADAIIRIIKKRAKEKGVTVAQLLASGS